MSPTPPLDERFALRPARAAEALDCSRPTIYALIRNGDLDAVKVGGCRLVTVESIRRLLDCSVDRRAA